MHKVNQNFINCKDKQNKDIIYEKQYISKKPSTMVGASHGLTRYFMVLNQSRVIQNKNSILIPSTNKKS